MRQLQILFVLSLVALAIPATASEDKIVSSGLQESEADGVKWKSVSFAYESCEEECHVATLGCNENGSVEFEFGDVDGKIAGAAIASDKQAVVITVGGKPFAFSIYEMIFAEMTGSWWLTSRLMDDTAPLFGALSTAKDFHASVETMKVTLPIGSDITDWIKACAD